MNNLSKKISGMENVMNIYKYVAFLLPQFVYGLLISPLIGEYKRAF